MGHYFLSLGGKMNSRDFLKNSAICASRSGERLGVGSLLLRSASSTKALADSPVSTGDELIVIAISKLLCYAKLQKFSQSRNRNLNVSGGRSR